MDNIVETFGLTKKYGEKTALDKVSIHVPQGEIYGLVGRNGAGKTTFMKIICGLSAQTSGEYTLFGKNAEELGLFSQRRGLLIENPGFYGNFDAKTNLTIMCSLLGIRDKAEPERLVKLVGLEGAGKKKIKHYSLGMKQRLGIALALAGNPDVVVLDEPINGLDPQGIVEMRELIRRMNKDLGTTFIISSHILDELSRISTRYGFINNGQLVEECSASELLEKCEEKIEIVTDNASAAAAILEKLGAEKMNVSEDGRITVYGMAERAGDISLALAAEGVTLLEMERNTGSVENYYLNLVGKEGK
ncbi:MAG: ATP-binding cassette domain-containing protein [Lachnospiraceae bacterium]|nr:ATP-binding cassette domain-containing protein [Lachnospiraceae bacterium]